MEASTIPVHRSDLEKIRDVLAAATRHHVNRDESNAALHLAARARYSPLTSELEAAHERVEALLAPTSEPPTAASPTS